MASNKSTDTLQPEKPMHQEEFIPLTAGNVRQPQTNANNNPKSKRKPSKPSSQSAAQKPQQQQQKKRKREDDGAKAEESNETAAAQTGGDTVQQDKSRKKRKPSKGPQNGANKQEQAKDAKKETMDIVQEADEDKVEEQSSKKKPKQTTTSQRTYSAFIGQLPFQAKESDIRNHFRSIGEGCIKQVRILTDKGTRRPKGAAFIDLSDETALNKALNMNNSQMGKRTITVNLAAESAQPKKKRKADKANSPSPAKIAKQEMTSKEKQTPEHKENKEDTGSSFVVRVNGVQSSTPEEVTKVFTEALGEENVKCVKMTATKAKKPRFCFIELANEEAVKQAITLSGTVLGDKSITVAPAKRVQPQQETPVENVDQKQEESAPAFVVLVSGLPRDAYKEEIITHFRIAEKEIKQVRLQKNKDGSVRAFIDVDNKEGLKKTLKMHKTILRNQVIKVVREKSGQVPALTPEEEEENDDVALTVEGQSKTPKKKWLPPRAGEKYIVFLGQLPFSATKESIIQHFRSVGEENIYDVRLLTIEGSNKPKGCAFMELMTKEALEKVLKLHHSKMGGRQINVELTAGGGGRSEHRVTKIKQKNQKLLQERVKRYEEAKQKQAGFNSQAAQDQMASPRAERSAAAPKGRGQRKSIPEGVIAEDEETEKFTF